MSTQFTIISVQPNSELIIPNITTYGEAQHVIITNNNTYIEAQDVIFPEINATNEEQEVARNRNAASSIFEKEQPKRKLL